MNELKQQAALIGKSWKIAFDRVKETPATWKPYLPNASIILLDEAATTLVQWISKTRTPSGFSPIFHLAKSLATGQLPPLLSLAQQLEAGQYAQLPNFANGVVGLLSTVHTMVVYAEKGRPSADALETSLSAELVQALALLDTAQKELAAKTEALSAASTAATEAEENRDSASLAAKAAVSALQTAEEARDTAIEKLEEVTEAEATIKNLHSETVELKDRTLNLEDQLIKAIDRTKEVQDRAMEQQNLITSLLPRAASAGLAEAFATRGASLEPIKWVWIAVFVLTLGTLAYFAHDLLTIEIDQNRFWPVVFLRVTLAAPLVWLGWFSAVQYGNVVRVQEDYAFKEATSKAFQGYRDHMEHLANIDSDDGGNAMNRLALETIAILAREPLRIYQGTHSDASPVQATATEWMGKLQRKKSDKDKED